MKENKEILDEFGQKVIKGAFDPVYGNLRSLKDIENPPIMFREYSDFIKSLSENDFAILQKYLADRIGSCLFDFLRVFEENEEFKLTYEKDGRKVNLVEISEMLKAEPIIENGWIERFSQVLKKE